MQRRIRMRLPPHLVKRIRASRLSTRSRDDESVIVRKRLLSELFREQLIAMP
jgi:hypothetical protein